MKNVSIWLIQGNGRVLSSACAAIRRDTAKAYLQLPDRFAAASASIPIRRNIMAELPLEAPAMPHLPEAWIKLLDHSYALSLTHAQVWARCFHTKHNNPTGNDHALLDASAYPAARNDCSFGAADHIDSTIIYIGLQVGFHDTSPFNLQSPECI